MKPDELRFTLAKLEISQADFSRLVEVTPRAISLWLSAEREIPGPVEAYIRLLSSLPPGQVQAELSRIREGVKTVKDGMYGINFSATAGQGFGLLVFENGRIYGTDTTKAKYDGSYSPNVKTSMVDVKIRVEMPANVQSVIGVVQPFDWMLDVSTSMNPALDSGDLIVKSNVGPTLNARYDFMRALPAQ